MNDALIKILKELNPWLGDPNIAVFDELNYLPRQQAESLLDPEWDELCTILIGPRQAGKTTLGKHLCRQL